MEANIHSISSAETDVGLQKASAVFLFRCEPQSLGVSLIAVAFSLQAACQDTCWCCNSFSLPCQWHDSKLGYCNECHSNCFCKTEKMLV